MLQNKDGSIPELSPEEQASMEATLSDALTEALRQETVVTSTLLGAKRMIQIGDYSAVPCGGTHLHNIREIGCSLTIEKIRRKKKRRDQSCL